MSTAMVGNRLQSMGFSVAALAFLSSYGCGSSDTDLMSDPRAGGSGGTGGNSSGSGGRAGNGAGGNAGKAAADGGAGPEGGRAFGGQAGALIGGASGEEAGAAGFGGGVGGEDQLGVCVLNEEPPNGKCRADGTLDFGAQLAGTQSTRLFRVDNLTSADVVFESVSVASSLFEVVSVRYVPDPEQPSQLLRVPEALPVSRAPGEALYFEVTYSAEGSAGPLPVSELRLGVESSAIRDDVVVVPMVGATLDCPVGFAACDSDPANGCETEIDSSQAHCGNCDTVCAFPHAASTCVEGECIRGTCEDGFGDCNGTTSDGCEAALASDVNNCGGCLHACAVELPGALTSCSEGSCKNEGCESGFVDLDHDPSDGCEYACTPTSGTDVPDDNFKDDNCDGIDGDASLAIFVATDGDDSNVGTAALPMATINAAILRAQASAKTQVYVSAGTYLGRVTLTNGISLYGGYSRSNGWTRSAAFVSEIRANAVANGRMSAVEGVNLTSSTTLDRFRIDTASTAQLGVSNYAMYCSSCSGLTLKNSSLEAGDAGPGAPGSNGPNGANGVSPSASGAAGSCDGSDYGVGALGGQLVCNGVSVSGGRGGDGGAEGVHAGTTGGTGSNGGGTGGPGGAGGDVGRSGTKGQSGTPVGASASGPGGSGGVISAGFWLGAAGGNGASGGHGRGGGGGGGGGGQGCTLCDDGSGNAGGGGGSGGCGGGAGFGGGAGGGAFGLFLVNSTGIVLSQNTIASGRGGQGGAGGIGGKGGSGALGVAGGQVCTDEVGKGGPGGDGSAGGQGGHGGGGAGGPAWGVYRSGTTVALVGNTIAPGIAGAGGTSLGNPGVPGAQGTAF